MGPTAIAALLTFNTVGGNWQKAVLLCFLAGITELLMGIFGLGFLVDFVSSSSNQPKHLINNFMECSL